MRRRSLNKQEVSREIKFGEAKDARKSRHDGSKVERFIAKSFKCKNFYWKQSEQRNVYGQLVGPQTAYCRETEKSCKYCNCPLIKK